MTNKELQDKLREFPDDMEVKIEVDRYCYEQCTPPYSVQPKVYCKAWDGDPWQPIGEEFIAIGEFGKL